MLNLLDKARGYFNPKFALEAQQYRQASALIGLSRVHEASRETPHYEVKQWDNPEDWDIFDLVSLRATSRDKYYNNGFYNGVVSAAVDHVVGSGLRSKSTINKRLLKNISDNRVKDIESMFDDYFNSWAESSMCDITAKDDFFEIQRLAYMQYKRDGDCFASVPLTPYASKKVLQVNFIGAEHITSNLQEYQDGIKVNKNGMPISYSILQKDNTFKKLKAFEKGKRNILHLFKRERAKLKRGMPFLSPVMRDVDAIDQYMKYELTAAKLSAIFFGSITSSSKDDLFGNEEDLLNPSEQKQTKKNTVKENSITQLLPGDELKIHESGRDNPNYDKFIMTSMQKVASETRIPLEIILTQFTSSYSASRAAMLQMQKFVKPERKLFVNSFCKPIREQVITWGVLSGDLYVPEFFENRQALLKAIWIGDPMGSVDPQKDVKAKVTAIDNHLLTREQASVELGFGDFETNVGILTKEKELIKPLIEEKQC